jgi:hypothetical protein
MHASSSVGGRVGVWHVQTALEQVLSEGVYGVAGLALADVKQAVSQNRHQVVQQVLSDGLRLVVKHFLLFVS